MASIVDLGVISSDQVFENLSFSYDPINPSDGTKYKFTLEDEYILAMTLTNSSGMSSTIQLCDEQNMPIQLDMSGSSIFAAGTYYIVPMAFSGLNYTLSVNCDKQLCTGNDSIQNACDLGVISGVKDIDGVYLESMETEYFKFTLNETSVLSLSATIGSGMSVTPTFYDAQGNNLNIMSHTGSTSAEFAAGTYYVSLGGTLSGAVDFVFTQEKILCSGNNTIYNAYDLGVISGTEDIDGIYLDGYPSAEYFRFTLNENSVLSLSATIDGDFSNTTTITFYDANWDIICFGNGPMAAEFTAGTYYVSLHSSSSDGGAADVVFSQSKILCSGNNSIASAYNLGVISGTKDLDGVYFDSMETEYFKFTLLEDSVLSLFATIGEGMYQANAMVSFYDAQGTNLNIIFDGIGGVSAEFTAGTYYVSLDSYGVSGAADVFFTQSKVLCSGNDSIENAYDLGVITGTKDIDGIYLSSMETEFFKFSLNEASVLSLSAIYNSAGTMNAGVTFYDAEGNTMNIMSYGPGPVSAEFAAGTYYVCLGGSGALDMLFTQSKALCTGNDSIENAYDLGAISGTKDVDGIYLSDMETEYFKFTLSEASVLSLSTAIGGNPSMNASITFYDAEGNNMNIMSYGPGPVSAEFAAGTYYVSLGSYGVSGAADVVFTQSKILCTGNDSIENAYDLGTIAGKKSFDGVFRVEMEIAEYYKFTIAEDSTVLLSVPAIPEYGGMNFMVDVYDEEQNVLMGETDFETGTLKIDLAAGTYYVSLDGGNYGFISLDFNVIEKDYDAPELPCTFSATVNDFDVTLDWNDVADKGEAGVKGYYVRYGSSAELEGEGFFVSESSCALEDLCVGKWYYQVKAVDNVDNASDWSEVQNFEVRYPGPSNLQGGADGLSWNAIPGVEGYIVEYSKDYFATVFRVECCSNGVDSFALPEGYWQWRVSAIDGDYSDGNYFSTAKDNAPQKYISVANDKKDIFFANAKGSWNSYFNAVYQGNDDIEAAVSLAGKNKITDVFAGSDDANMLVLTDDACGDALFLDDIYSAFGDEQRLSRINEIRAGAGDDIVDLTSSRFAVDSFSPVVYGGDGNDTIWANNGSNIIFGDAGNDNIIGGAYNDIIVGGTGNDTLHGGGGYDIFCFGGDWGNDTVEQIAGGTAILWFEDDNGEWDELTRTYTAGENSVTFSGDGSIFVLSGTQGDIDNFNDLYSLGCFSEVASDKIFDDDNKGILA